MKREELETYYKTSCVKDTEVFYSKEQADSVMDAMEARIKEIEADKLRQENYCESLVNENKRLNEIIISKDMVGAELHNENKALRHNLEDWKAENEALKERIKELEEQSNKLTDICEKNRVRRIIDKERIKELEDKVQMHDFFWEGCSLSKRGFKNTIDVANYIKELEAMQPKWISVEDEMPNDEALLLHENGLINVGGYVEEDKIWIGFGHVQLNDVHHWMPLPQPPKSEE